MFKRFIPFIFCITFALTWACKENKKVVKQTEIAFKKEGVLTITKLDATTLNLDIEIADTEFDTQTGLMYRNALKNNQGMLFVFNDVTARFFYMKNTKIPLDIIYIDEQKKMVSFQKNAKPLDESSLPSGVPAKYVLEVNAGLVDAWSLSVGDSIHYITSN